MNAAAKECVYRGERSLAGKAVGVLGLARSGAACVRFLKEQGARVTALDSQALGDISAEGRAAAELADRVAAPYEGVQDLMPVEMLVISPGVPTESAIVRQTREAGVEVIGEVELAYRFCAAPMVAVTGTCGKGTTVTTLGALLDAAGQPNVVAGNIGLPLIGEAARSAGLEVLVAEISSFQLETTVHFRPHIAILLNITEDHLERYRGFEEYVAAKRLIFRNQTGSDWAILCTDDAEVGKLVGHTRSQALTVGLHDGDASARLEGEDLVIQLPGGKPEIVAAREDLMLKGDHHVMNSLAAALAARLCGAPAAVMADALRGYRPAAHLMQLVGEYEGVRYIDDSKATNPASAIADLSGIEGPVIVIAGGKEKQTDFGEFGAVLARRAKGVILIGECAGRIEQAVGRPELCHTASSLDEAVRMAVAMSEPGDTVALCPGCSSLDMFESYARRGELFGELVAKACSERA